MTTLLPSSGDNHGALQFLGINLGIDLIDLHPGQTRGYPSFEHWPAADDIKHRQVGLRWLKDAHDNGLNVIVASVVNNQWPNPCAPMTARAPIWGQRHCPQISGSLLQIGLTRFDGVVPVAMPIITNNSDFCKFLFRYL